jgi:septum formation protein
MKIILASQSKQRLDILRTLGLPIKVIPAYIDEKAVPYSDRYDKALQIALAKAQKVASKQKNAIVVAADTFCYLKGRILEKPKNLQEARAMLLFQSGQEIEVLTGYAFLNTKLHTQKTGCEKILVRMRQLSTKQIEKYINNEPVLTWSAAFSPAYDSGIALIKSINGNLTAFSHGLPLDILVDFLSVNNEKNCRNPQKNSS